MNKYDERQFTNKEQSIKIPNKPKMEEYIERLETIVKRWAGEEIVLQGDQPLGHSA